MKRGVIYSIVCLVTLEEYIGQTNGSVRERWREHCWAARRGSKLRLSRAIRAYGEANFAVSVIWRGSVDLLDDKEVYYIDKFETFSQGYNMTEGGDGFRGLVKTPQHRLGISEGRKRYFANNPEARLIPGAYLRGKKLSAKKRRSLAIANKKHWKNPKHRKAASDKQKLVAQDPVYKAAQSERMRLKWQDSTYRAHMSKVHVEYYVDNPEARLAVGALSRGREVSAATRAKLSITSRRSIASKTPEELSASARKAAAKAWVTRRAKAALNV